jgi:hypothetical protein
LGSGFWAIKETTKAAGSGSRQTRCIASSSRAWPANTIVPMRSQRPSAGRGKAEVGGAVAGTVGCGV